MKPRLLVVGADALRGGAFGEFARDGFQVTLVDGGTTHRYEHLVDRYVFADAADETCDLEPLARLAREHDGVVTLADGSQRTAALLAESAGLPSPGLTASSAARDKSAQRRLARQAGLLQPRSQEAGDAAELLPFLASATGPVVVKPADGGGSMGVSIVDDPAQARAAWHLARAFSRSARVLIEDFIPGVETTVEGVVSRGRLVAFSVTDKTLGGPDGVIELDHTSAGEHPWRQALQAELQAVLDAVAFDTGIVHAEFRVEAGSVCLLEFGARPGGNLIPEITRMATGINLYGALARMSIGGSISPLEPATHPYARVQFLIGSGTVRRRLTRADLGYDLPTLQSIGQLAPPACRVPPPTNNWGYAGYAVGAGPDRDALFEQLRVAGRRMLGAMGLTDLTTTPTRGNTSTGGA